MAAGLSLTTAKTSPYRTLQTYGMAAAAPPAPTAPVPDPLLGTPGGTLGTPGTPAPSQVTDWFSAAKAGTAPAPVTTNAQASYEWASNPANQRLLGAGVGGLKAGPARPVGPRPVDEAAIAANRANAAEAARQQAALEAQAKLSADEYARQQEAWRLQNNAAIEAAQTEEQRRIAAEGRQLTAAKTAFDQLRDLTTPTVPTAAASPAAPGLPATLPHVGLGGTPVYGGGGVAEPGSSLVTKEGGGLLSSADAAAWARAKDKIGRQTRGAMTSLKDLQAARGFGPESGVYADEERQLLGTGLSALGDVARSQAEDALAAARAREAMVYQGDITQRAQDLGLTTAGMNVNVATRGQDISAAQAAADRQAQLLGSYLSLLRFGGY